MFSHHVWAAGGALGGWHELGLALPPNAVAPQSLADILEEGGGRDKELAGFRSWSAFILFSRIANLKGGADRYLTTAANKDAGNGKDGTMGSHRRRATRELLVHADENLLERTRTK